MEEEERLDSIKGHPRHISSEGKLSQHLPEC